MHEYIEFVSGMYGVSIEDGFSVDCSRECE